MEELGLQTGHRLKICVMGFGVRPWRLRRGDGYSPIRIEDRAYLDAGACDADRVWKGYTLVKCMSALEGGNSLGSAVAGSTSGGSRCVSWQEFDLSTG